LKFFFEQERANYFVLFSIKNSDKLKVEIGVCLFQYIRKKEEIEVFKAREYKLSFGYESSTRPDIYF
jgi:hypothetical protein